MNSKIDNGLEIYMKPVSLKSLLEKDINRLNSVSGEGHLNIDKSIHTIRKSLKSISAILLLCEVHFDRIQYLSWQLSIKSLSKKYGDGREPYVYLQTFNQIKKKLKSFDNGNHYELGFNLELQHKLIVNDIKNRNETVLSVKDSITNLAAELNNLDFNFEYKHLRRRLIISFQKSRRLFKRLRLSSSSCDYHRFRKWCKIYYHQQIILDKIGSVKMPGKNKKLYKLTEFLGDEHNLQVFYQYLSTHFPELSQHSEALFRLKTKRLRKKALALYPKINKG